MVITRFAPSPTNPKGEGLHVGGLRTALYNYVYAKKHGGKFILRIEDTDVERSNEQCFKSILKDFAWAGIQFDAGFKLDNDTIVPFNDTDIDFGPMQQSQRKDIYDSWINKLLEMGKAYEKDGAIYFSMPKEDVTFTDEVLGTVTLPAKDCQDFVIRKSSGMPSFYFAMTCDDHCMGVTHVIRGCEHLNTAYRQVALQKVAGFNPVTFCHIPLIFNPDGSKMSKRQAVGQVNTNDFRKDGYLPDAILNYLALLGWNPGNNREIFDLDFMIKNFDLKDIGKTNGRFDYKKLLNFNGQYITNLSFDNFNVSAVSYGIAYYNDAINNLNLVGSKEYRDSVLKLFHSRSKTLKDVFINTKWTYESTSTFNSDDVSKVLPSVGALQMLEDRFSYTDWTKEGIMESINSIVANESIKTTMGKVGQVIRLAVTGGLASPPIDDVLVLLGKEESMNRIKFFLEKYTSKAAGV